LLLRLRDLHSGYGAARILHGVSIDVAQGEIVSVLGPNGAGKTTMLRTISGVVKARHGTVEFAGKPLSRQSIEARSRAGIGHVPEGRGILATLTVEENLMLGTTFRARRSAEISRDRGRLLDLFPAIVPYLKKPASVLSGGQQQMLAMAAAYVRDPRLVLVDEASLGLAPLVVDQIFESLQRLTKEGSSLLIVDQFAVRALSMANTAYVMRRGEIAFHGDAKELLKGDLFSRYVGS
jgi:branched-chain amino acid transport system ATP-binding protein